MSREILFNPSDTVEQRKYHVAEAMRSAAPFHLKRVLIDMRDGTVADYTGSFTQMLLARAMTLIYTTGHE